MHLKLLIGVLTLGLAVASPKPAAKPDAKPSHQYYPNGQTFNAPSNSFGYNYVQSYPGQPSLGYYNVKYASENYGNSAGYPVAAPYPQASSNYYQPQLIPVPVAYSSYPGNDVYNGYNGGARLWPKNFVSPTGSPSPVTASSPPLYYPSSTPSPVAYQSSSNYVNSQFGSSPQIYYPSSTPSPVAYQSTGNYVNSQFGNHFQVPVSTPAPVQPQYHQPLIPVPVKVGLRNSFQPEVTNYNTVSQTSSVTPTPHFPKYQQHSTPAPFLQQSYQQPKSYQQVTSTPYVARYQQPTAFPYQVNYHQQPHSYQQSTVSPFPAYQSSASPYVAQYQKPAVNLYSANYQRIPVPVSYPQVFSRSNIPTSSYPVTPTVSYPSTPVQSQPISIVPTSSTTAKTVAITEKPYVPVLTTHAPFTKPKATIIKSEYSSGSVSPQYNFIPTYSTASPFVYSANQYLPHTPGKPTYYPPSFNPFKSVNGYSPSTAVSHVSYNGLGANYSYKK